MHCARTETEEMMEKFDVGSMFDSARSTVSRYLAGRCFISSA